MEKTVIKVDVQSNLDDTLRKATQLQEKMQEVKTLAGELATCISNLKLEIKV